MPGEAAPVEQPLHTILRLAQGGKIGGCQLLPVLLLQQQRHVDG